MALSVWIVDSLKNLKQGRRLTRTEKEILRKHMLIWSEWEFLADVIDDTGRPTNGFKIQHKKTGVIKIINRV